MFEIINLTIFIKWVKFVQQWAVVCCLDHNNFTGTIKFNSAGQAWHSASVLSIFYSPRHPRVSLGSGSGSFHSWAPPDGRTERLGLDDSMICVLLSREARQCRVKCHNQYQTSPHSQWDFLWLTSLSNLIILHERDCQVTGCSIDFQSNLTKWKKPGKRFRIFLSGQICLIMMGLLSLTLSIIWLATVTISLPRFHSITKPSSRSTMQGSLTVSPSLTIMLELSVVKVGVG